MDTFLINLHNFFSDQATHQLPELVVFAPGTAPMRKENSEISDILFATNFDVLYAVDPVYGVTGGAVEIDIQAIRMLSQDAQFFRLPHGFVRASFPYEKRVREVVFVPGDATLPEFQPTQFTILFSGKRIGMYPGFGLRGSPSDYLPDILKRLSVGGYVVPDRDLLDDRVYFSVPSLELGLEEVTGIRTEISKEAFPHGYSEGKRFMHSDTAPGVGLYKKVKVY